MPADRLADCFLVKGFNFTSEFKGLHDSWVGAANLNLFYIQSDRWRPKARKGLFYYFIFFDDLPYHRAYLITSGQRKLRE